MSFCGPAYGKFFTSNHYYNTTYLILLRFTTKQDNNLPPNHLIRTHSVVPQDLEAHRSPQEGGSVRSEAVRRRLLQQRLSHCGRGLAQLSPAHPLHLLCPSPVLLSASPPSDQYTNVHVTLSYQSIALTHTRQYTAVSHSHTYTPHRFMYTDNSHPIIHNHYHY